MNEPAFPSTYKDFLQTGTQLSDVVNKGMTLRDYFAAKAMQGMIRLDVSNYPAVAEWSYQQADAMLKEREKYHG